MIIMVYNGRGGGGFILFLVSLILGLYFINYPLKFVDIPAGFSAIDPWLIFIGGFILIISSVINLFRPRYY